MSGRKKLTIEHCRLLRFGFRVSNFPPAGASRFSVSKEPNRATPARSLRPPRAEKIFFENEASMLLKRLGRGASPPGNEPKNQAGCAEALARWRGARRGGPEALAGGFRPESPPFAGASGARPRDPNGRKTGSLICKSTPLKMCEPQSIPAKDSGCPPN